MRSRRERQPLERDRGRVSWGVTGGTLSLSVCLLPTLFLWAPEKPGASVVTVELWGEWGSCV